MNLIIYILLFSSPVHSDTCVQKLLNKVTSDTSFNGYLVLSNVEYYDGKVRKAFVEYRALHYFIKEQRSVTDVEAKIICKNLLDTGNFILPISKVEKYFTVTEPDKPNKMFKYFKDYDKFNSYYVAENGEFILDTATGFWFEVLSQLWNWSVGVRIMFGYPTVGYRCKNISTGY